MNTRRLWAIILKEIRQLRRDRLTLGMVLGIPVLQLLLFGFAINLDVRRLPAAIADEADTWASRAFVQDLVATGVVEVKARPTLEQALAALSPFQAERLRRAGAELAARHRDLSSLAVRLDMVALAPGRLPRHISDI